MSSIATSEQYEEEDEFFDLGFEPYDIEDLPTGMVNKVNRYDCFCHYIKA